MPIGQVPGYPTRKTKPKPSVITKSEDFITTGEGSGNIPGSSIGSIVAQVLGRKRVPNANTIWTGNLRPIKKVTYNTVITTEEIEVDGYVETITTETTTITTTIEGYLCDIHMGICLGPEVVLKGIYVDNLRIWSGSIGPARTEAAIGTNLTFLSGATIVFSGGAFDQAPEPLVAMADYPGYVGIATILLKDVRVDLPMGNISFEVVRVPNPLALPDGVNRNGDDLNTASAMVEVMTNEWGYGSIDIADVDVDNFTEAAEKLDTEGNFCAVKLDSESGIASVLSILQDQANAIVFQNPKTAKMQIALVRPDEISYGSALKLGPRNIIDLTEYRKSGWPDTVETLRGMFTSRDANYNETPVFMQNAASLSQSGRGKRTATIYYPFSPTRELTAALLARDMQQMAVPLYSFSVTTNREAAELLPGDVTVVTWPKYDLLNVPMLVAKVRKQDINYNTVSLGLRQLKLPDTAGYGIGGDPYDPGFDLDPKTPLACKILTAPYYMARQRNGINGYSLAPVNFPIILPTPGNDYQSDFDVIIENAPGVPGDVTVSESCLYPTVGQLLVGISRFDGFATGIIPSLTIHDVINPLNLSQIDEDGVRAGELLAFIGDEIVSFEDATDDGGNTWTLTNVHRGLLDTVAADHAINAEIHIISGGGFTQVVKARFPYPVGWTPDWVIIPNTLTQFGTKDIGFSTSSWAPDGVRTLSPPRPHNTKVDAQPRSSTPVTIVSGDSCTVDWFSRTRLAFGVTLQLDPAESPEIKGTDSQTHRVILVDSLGVEHDCGTAAWGIDTLTFSVPAAAPGEGSIFVQAEMTFHTGIAYGDLEMVSLQRDLVPVLVLNDETFISEDSGDYFITEDGASFFVSEAY